MFNPKPVRWVCCDLFGTYFDLSKTPREELKAYGHHIKQPWAPLTLPTSWANLPKFKDVECLTELRRYVNVATLSNCPFPLQMDLCKDLEFDAYINLGLAKVFKPNRRAYLYASAYLNTPPENILMLSANEHFGDLEWSKSVGMQSQLLRGEEFPTLAELTNYFANMENYR